MGFRGLPAPHIAQLRQRDMREEGPEDKVPGAILSLNLVFSFIMPNFTFRRLLSASVDFRLRVNCSIQTT